MVRFPQRLPVLCFIYLFYLFMFISALAVFVFFTAQGAAERSEQRVRVFDVFDVMRTRRVRLPLAIFFRRCCFFTTFHDSEMVLAYLYTYGRLCVQFNYRRF